MRHPILYSTLSVLAFGLIACDPSENPPGEGPPPLRPINKTDALTTANQNLRNVLTGGARSGQVLDQSDLLGNLFSIGKSADVSAPCPPDEPCEPTPTPRTLENEAEDMAAEVAARVLNASNVEVEEELRIVLRLKPEVLCHVATASSSGLPSGSTCLAAYAAVPVRLELSSRRAGDVDVRYTVGNGSPVATLELHAESLAVEVDLAAMMAAYNSLAVAGGNTRSMIEGSYAGRLRAELRRNAELDYSLIGSVMSPIMINAQYQGESIRIELASANPAVRVRLDGINKLMTSEVSTGVGLVEIPLSTFSGSSACPPQTPGSPPCEQPPPVTGTIELHIPPINGSTSLAEGDHVHTSFGMGDALVVRHQNSDVFRLDINPSSGRRIESDFTITDSNVTIELASAFLVQADFNLASIADALDAPAWLQNESLSAQIDGAAKPSLSIDFSSATPVDGGSGGSGSGGTGGTGGTGSSGPSKILHMLLGQLRLHSRAAGIDVNVPAGQCLIYNEPASGGSGHPFDGLSAGACE